MKTPKHTRLGLLRLALLFGLILAGSSTNAEEPQAAPFGSDETLASLLDKGELTLVESHPDSSLKQVTAIVLVHSPIDRVWKLLNDYLGYKSWMPKVASVEIKKEYGTQSEVEWEIEVPGPNYTYVMKNSPDEKKHYLWQEQVSGSLKGSHWSWQLIPRGNNTLVFRTVFTNVTRESWVARQLDDKSHTLSYGINVSSSLVEVRALRHAAEQGK